MDFADEHYVKMFPRDTVTWRRWPWQAKALLWPLLRKLTKAGVLNIGTRGEPHVNVALMVELPAEVVEVGLRAYLEDGTAELHDGNVVVPKFLEAQESRKTKAATAREYREKQRDVARAKSAGFLEPTVTKRDQPLPTVTNGDPPSPTPARPLPDPDPEKLAGEKPPAAKRVRPAKAEKPPDPRHAPLVKELAAVFVRKRRPPDGKYPWDPRDAKAVSSLLSKGMPPTIVAAYDRALDATHPTTSSFWELDLRFAKYVAPEPSASASTASAIAAHSGMQREVKPCAICGAPAEAKFAEVQFCYRGCLSSAEAWGREQNPDAPWEADVATWAREQHEQAEAERRSA